MFSLRSDVPQANHRYDEQNGEGGNYLFVVMLNSGSIVYWTGVALVQWNRREAAPGGKLLNFIRFALRHCDLLGMQLDPGLVAEQDGNAPLAVFRLQQR